MAEKNNLKFKYVAYDIEVLPNVFTMTMASTDRPFRPVTFEVSHRKNDAVKIIHAIMQLRKNGIVMVGFNNYSYDYVVIHYLLENFEYVVGDASVFTEAAYKKSKMIINTPFNERFTHSVPPWEWLVKQCDLLKINHFDNKAKMTSLKRLEFNMRRKKIVEFGVDFDKRIYDDSIIDKLIVYNKEDVDATIDFFHHCLELIVAREDLIEELGDGVMTYSDVKIGASIITSRLEESFGAKALYTWEEDEHGVTHRKPKGSPIKEFPMQEVIFPGLYNFKAPEFQRIYEDFQKVIVHVIRHRFHWTQRPDYLYGLNLMAHVNRDIQALVLGAKNVANPDDKGSIKDEVKKLTAYHKELRNKYVFPNPTCTINGREYCFGKGGVHASGTFETYRAEGKHIIRDVDVSGMYPSISIAYNMYPKHLPKEFRDHYIWLRTERAKYKKGTGRSNALKLGSNSVFGNSNNPFSIFYDPTYALKTTINGQLLIILLVDRLLHYVPGIEIIQANTDGITYRIHEKYLDTCKKIEKLWEKHTKLELEDAAYSAIYIRDVNNYIAVTTKGKIKMKGCYNTKELFDGSDDTGIAWHKNHSAQVIAKAAVAYLTNGTPIRDYIVNEENIFEFCLCTNVNRSSKLLYNGTEIQRNSRYVVSLDGGHLIKTMPPIKDKTEDRRFAICSDQNVTILNDMSILNDDVAINYEYYIDEAKKLIDGFV